MPTTSIFASSRRDRKLSARTQLSFRADPDEEEEDEQEQSQEGEFFVMDERESSAHDGDGDEYGKELLVIDWEASYASNSGIGSGSNASSSITSSLVLLQYPSSSHSSSSSSSSSSSNNKSSGGPAVLPPLSGDAVRNIQTPLLFPVAVVPQHVPRATEIQLFLSHIEYIEINSVVTREEGVVYYVLDVYRYRQQNGLPTTRRRSSAPPPMQQQNQQQQNQSAPASTPSSKLRHPLQRGGSSQQTREPDYQIEHRYSSFARLRSNVWQIARKRHRRGRACAYCGSLNKFFMESDAQPNLKVKFTTNTEKRKEILGKFINDLLFAARDDHVQCARSLRGYHHVPVLMKRFLNEQTGETFFS
ncbi:hypothetical protein Gpo141_00009079 [Globisporangium polare]